MEKKNKEEKVVDWLHTDNKNDQFCIKWVLFNKKSLIVIITSYKHAWKNYIEVHLVFFFIQLLFVLFEWFWDVLRLVGEVFMMLLMCFWVKINGNSFLGQTLFIFRQPRWQPDSMQQPSRQQVIYNFRQYIN
jgi:hypothetical protein